MLINRAELGGEQAVQFMTAMSNLNQSCQSLINQANRYIQRLDLAEQTAQVHQLHLQMQAWLDENPVLELHLNEGLCEMGQCITSFNSGLVDALDIEISKVVIIEKLRTCVQVLSIEQELIDSLWAMG